MSENMENQNDQEEEFETEEEGESFAELLESYQAGMSEDLKVGDKIKGRIIAMDATNVFVDTGTKVDGVVDKEDLMDDSDTFPYEQGDQLELYVVKVDESEIKLSRAIAGIGGLNMLQEAYKSRIPVEGKVKAVIKGGFQVDVLQRTAFCPISQMDIKYVETPEDYVGETYQFMVKRFEENGRNIVISRREILEKEQREAQQAYLKDLVLESIVEGKVTRLMPYGAFVELTPGLEGMVHISELSWSRLQKPDEAVKPGDTVRVKVLGMEPGKKEGQLKISLSAKQATGDPWDTLGDTIHNGDRIKGKVTRCMEFGAFVEVSTGIEGLVHVSEMSYVKRVHHPEDIVTAGDTVWVLVKEVDAVNRRISLSIRDAEGDPWADIHDKYSIGQAVEGIFEKKEKFGYFVTLEPGVTGLVPKSKVGKTSAAGAIDKLKQGDAITVIIDEIQSEARRISLGITDAKDEENWQSFSEDSGQSLGALGEQLKRALENNNS
ncbi:MAG TPA: 30S ribosomal protein S1 [Deltaproteobacteria bacterium]|nr:30S ribosomal protein S1 [Deltaproteobacteria bacterium]